MVKPEPVRNCSCPLVLQGGDWVRKHNIGCTNNLLDALMISSKRCW